MLITRIVTSTLVLALLAAGAHWARATVSGPEAKYGYLETAHRFDFPVGAPDGEGYYDAQPFGENFHLGEDWNGLGGGATDKGDPVYAVGKGVVTYVDEAGKGWGKVVRIVHHVRHNGRSDFVESLYAHLDSFEVAVGDPVTRGQVVGSIGDADGIYVPHLHFEIRRTPDLPIGPGYSPDDSQWLDPSAFIRAHR
ncbi:MAG: M23 family metallopeptidase [Myxococcales bacterium]|nr:M23 family metallopeptidase [Myxococcales bacterium]